MEQDYITVAEKELEKLMWGGCEETKITKNGVEFTVSVIERKQWPEPNTYKISKADMHSATFKTADAEELWESFEEITNKIGPLGVVSVFERT